MIRTTTLALLLAVAPAGAEPTTRPMTPGELIAAGKAELAAARADAEAAGIATTLESFAATRSPVPPDQDAAVELMVAAKVMDSIESMAWQAWEEREVNRPPPIGITLGRRCGILSRCLLHSRVSMPSCRRRLKRHAVTSESTGRRQMKTCS